MRVDAVDAGDIEPNVSIVEASRVSEVVVIDVGLEEEERVSAGVAVSVGAGDPDAGARSATGGVEAIRASLEPAAGLTLRGDVDSEVVAGGHVEATETLGIGSLDAHEWLHGVRGIVIRGDSDSLNPGV